jgi:hypothetical protein
MSLMRTSIRLLVLLFAVASAAAARPSTSVPPVNQPLVGPQAALERLADGFRDLAPDSIAASLTADYRFHAHSDSLPGFLGGSSRDDEVGFVRSLMRGVIRDGDTVMAAADSVGMTLDGIGEGMDPGASGLDALLPRAHRAPVRVRLPARRAASTSRRARTCTCSTSCAGMVARLLPGQPADSTRWYVRRWLEDVTGINAELLKARGRLRRAARSGAGSHSGGGRTPAVPTVLALHALMNPACAKLEVRCDLPGLEPARVQVYDVSGRRVNQRDVPVAAAGTLTIEAGRGASLNPGVYWVRVGQGARTPVHAHGGRGEVASIPPETRRPPPGRRWSSALAAGVQWNSDLTRDQVDLAVGVGSNGRRKSRISPPATTVVWTLKYALPAAIAARSAASAPAAVPPLAVTYDALYVAVSVRSNVWSIDPAVTPSREAGERGVIVATPAVPVSATAVGAWMWHAVVLPRRPLNDACTRMVFATSSMVISATPTPGEAFTGTSFGR